MRAHVALLLALALACSLLPRTLNGDVLRPHPARASPEENLLQNPEEGVWLEELQRRRALLSRVKARLRQEHARTHNET
ncbi:hypothetical protein R5R35_003061 [Gryllus longicercus]|uniref:Uncharacterized protein n=1 Tax=Gryllus longicercus TaxID=2509291 RepID=A0AAN9VBR3_9ORTH